MTELLPIMLGSIFLAYLSDQTSKIDKSSGQYIKKEYFFFTCMCIAMILFVGLRYHYNDTLGYRITYSLIDEKKGIFEDINWSPAGYPGFTLLNRVLKKLSFSEQSFLMTYSIIYVGIYCWFLRKYSTNFTMTIFLFMTMGCFTFCMAAMKQCTAVAFCLVATDRAIQKKYFQFVLWIIIAMMFHPFSFMYLLVPILMFTPWTHKTTQMLTIFGLLAFLLQFSFSSIVAFTSLLGADYNEELLSGEGVNIFRVIVVWAPVLLSLFVRKQIQNNTNPVNNLMFNLTVLNAGIMFVGLFGTANYFARLANYFVIFQAISIPWIISLFPKTQQGQYKIATIVGYSVFVIYSNVVIRKFDDIFSSISLLDYLKSLF